MTADKLQIYSNDIRTLLLFFLNDFFFNLWVFDIYMWVFDVNRWDFDVSNEIVSHRKESECTKKCEVQYFPRLEVWTLQKIYGNIIAQTCQLGFPTILLLGGQSYFWVAFFARPPICFFWNWEPYLRSINMLLMTVCCLKIKNVIEKETYSKFSCVYKIKMWFIFKNKTIR